MKLIIDIPEEVYKYLTEYQLLPSDFDYEWMLVHGTPLPKVFEDIKAEIDKAYCKVENDYDHGRNYGLYMANQIIDKHISGKENNEKII